MQAQENGWQPSAAYLFALALDGPGLAWEYLRRNPSYRAAYAQASKQADDAAFAATWALRSMEDPSRDARYAQPIWLTDPDGMPELHPAASAAITGPFFSLWQIPGRKQLAHDGHRLHLAAYRPEGTARTALSPAIEHGMTYVHALTGGARLRMRWRAAVATTERLDAWFNEAASSWADVSAHGHSRARPNRDALLHMRSLQALDALSSGATDREIAGALFGESVAAERWHDLGELRAQVRRLVVRGQHFMNGDYRRLLQSDPHGNGRSG